MFRRPLVPTTLFGVCAVLSPLAHAINGINLTGYGAESSALGGPDAPLSRDTFAATLNPAGLARIENERLDLYVTAFDSPDNTHTDAFNTRKHVSNELYYGAYGGFGYAKRLPDSNVTLGTVLVVQGGNGYGYKHLVTRFNTVDEFSGVFGISKLALAAGWKASPNLRLGASVGLSYSTSEQSVFPDTSVANTFYGSRVKGLSGFSASAKLGMQYQIGPDATFGIYYGTPTKLRLQGGSMRVNYSADPVIGQVVRYDDVEVDGLALPEELAAGIAFRPLQPLMTVVQLKWYGYKDSLNATTLTATSPRNPLAPPLSQTSPINARDQLVLSLGVAYDYDADTVLRAGINYNNRVVPDQNLSPTFFIAQTRHWSIGAERKLDANWSVGGAFEVYPRKKVTYSPGGGIGALFGGNVTDSNGGNVLTLMVSRNWP